MEFETVISAISTIGFPIVMCLILMWYVNKSTETHRQEIDELRTTIENNTQALIKLVAMLGGGKNE